MNKELIKESAEKLQEAMKLEGNVVQPLVEYEKKELTLIQQTILDTAKALLEMERERVTKKVWSLFKKWEFQADSRLMMEIEELAESLT